MLPGLSSVFVAAASRMVEFVGSFYLWLKAFHIVAVISWMAGLLYLPRLFVYHCEAEPGSIQSETFKVMERRLLKAIMTPAMVVSWILGLAMVVGTGAFEWTVVNWFHFKLALVVVLTGFHWLLGRHVYAFSIDQNQVTGRTFRILNEVPTVIMIAVVILVVVKP